MGLLTLFLLLLSGSGWAQTAGPPNLYCNKSLVVSAGATSITQIGSSVKHQDWKEAATCNTHSPNENTTAFYVLSVF
jgi:hypothetical protein